MIYLDTGCLVKEAVGCSHGAEIGHLLKYSGSSSPSTAEAELHRHAGMQGGAILRGRHSHAVFEHTVEARISLLPRYSSAWKFASCPSENSNQPDPSPSRESGLTFDNFSQWGPLNWPL